MSLKDWAGYKNLRDINDEEQEPYVLPIIIRLEKDENFKPSHEEAQLAVGYAITKLFDSEIVMPDGEWNESFTKWLNGRIRKVSRRARGSEWEAVKSLPHIYTSYGKAEIIILKPHPNFEPPAEIKKLQISGIELAKENRTGNSNNILGLKFTVNPEINMSTGKTLAQVGHAVQLAIFNSTPETVELWVEQKTPINHCGWNEYTSWTAEIHDAGFTEIPAGSLTAKSKL